MNPIDFINSYLLKVPSNILTSTNKNFEYATLFIRSNFLFRTQSFIYFSATRTFAAFKNNDIDIIISTEPPHSIHLIAKT